MEQKEIKSILIDIISPYLSDEINPNEITHDKHLINDLKINSANIVDIVLDIEDRFDIVIDDDIIGKMNTIQDSIDVVKEKVAV